MQKTQKAVLYQIKIVVRCCINRSSPQVLFFSNFKMLCDLPPPILYMRTRQSLEILVRRAPSCE